MIFVSPGGDVEHCVVRDNRNIRMIWLFYSTLLFVTSNIAITDVTDVITTGSDIFIFFFFSWGVDLILIVLMLNFSLETSYNIKVHRDLLEWTLYENISTCTFASNRCWKSNTKKTFVIVLRMDSPLVFCKNKVRK